jgi:two-component system cell cycle sensor histidine kinase/response regulator CckA
MTTFMSFTLKEVGQEMKEGRKTKEQMIKELRRRIEELERLEAERKQVQEALRVSEEKYRVLVENASEAIVVAQDGMLKFSNPKASEVTGYSKQELFSKPFVELIHPDDRGLVVDRYLRRLKGDEFINIYPFKIVDTHGNIKWVEINAVKIDWEGRPATLNFLTDITEYKRTEEAFKEGQQKFKNIIEHSNELFYIHDPEHKLTYISPQSKEVLGYTPEEMMIEWTTLITENPINTVGVELTEKTLKTGRRQGPYLLELYKKDRSRVLLEIDESPLIDEAGRVIGIVGAARDVTEKKRAEGLLKASEEQYRDLVEHSQDLMCTHDLQGNLLSVNRWALKVLGYDQSFLLQKNIRNFLLPELRSEFDGYLSTILTHREASGLMIVVTGKGERRTWEYRSTLRTEGVAEPIVRAMAHDITERILAEKSLKESEEKFRAITHTASDAILLLDNEGRVSYWNPSAEKMFGYRSEEAMGKEIHLFLAPERYHEDYKEGWAKFKATGQGPAVGRTNDFFAVRKDGTEFPIEVSTSAIQVGGKWCSVGIIRDITDRKRMFETLQQSEYLYRTLTESSLTGIYMSREGHYVFANEMFYKIVGYSWEDLKSIDPLDLIAPEERNRIAEIFRKRLSGEDVVSEYETKMIHRDGTKLDVQVRAALIQFENKPTVLGNMIDVTKRKRAEEALKASEEKYRTLVESTSDAILMSNEEREIISVNQAFCHLFGFNKGEIEGKSTRTIHPSEESFKSFGELAYPIVEKARSFRSEWNLLRKDGTIFPVETVVSAIVSPNGSTEGVVGIIRDITERKQAEKEMVALQEQLQQSQKMEAVGRLAGGVAHDFNNLLTVLLGTSQLILLELDKDNPLRDRIEEIIRTSERAATLTRQLLAFSRRQIMEFKVLDLNAVIKNLGRMLLRIIGEDIELVTVFAEDLGKIKSDSGQIEQVMMNLAVNGKDAMPHGGKLIIETDNAELDEDFARSHAGTKAGQYVRLMVSDTGKGMPPEVREKIFEPFFTTKEKGKGTGLGLSTVYGIVRQSGGNIWVYSEPGKGATFKIYFPRVDEPLEAFKETLERVEFPRGSETILVVEDGEEVRKFVVRILKRQGYQVLEAPNGEEALVLSQHYEGPIHLVLTDVVMPGMSGRELANALLNLRPELKVIYMSGYTDNSIVHHGILEKGIHYVQKPFTIEGLARKIQEILK